MRARRRRRQKEKTSVLIVFLRSAPLLAVLTHKRVDEKSRQNDNYESVQNILPHRIPLWSVPSNAPAPFTRAERRLRALGGRPVRAPARLCELSLTLFACLRRSSKRAELRRPTESDQRERLVLVIVPRGSANSPSGKDRGLGLMPRNGLCAERSGMCGFVLASDN